MAKVAFSTLGCKVNQYDTRVFMEELSLAGWELVEPNEGPDLIIINSCVVTNEAARQSRQRARHFKKLNPQATIVLAGCYPRAFLKEAQQIKGIDLIFNTFSDADLITFLETKAVLNKRPKLIKDDKDTFILHDFSGRARAVLKVQDGCESYCSYCIIPKSRGKLKSKPLPIVLKEVDALIKSGFKEIVLAGIHLGHYGKDQPSGPDLLQLVKAILQETNIYRLRLSSLEITEVTDNFLELFKDYKALCPHLHLSLQSGSNDILQKMNRQYTKEEYLNICKNILQCVSDIALTTDIITGFPGETEENFQETVELVKDISFSNIHVFPYSQRTGTPAAKMPGQVPMHIKKERARILRTLANKDSIKYKKRFLGEDLEVLIEGHDDDKALFFGTSANYIKVFWPSFAAKNIGDTTTIKATELFEEGLKGTEV